ncbi:hydrogenase small subunit [Salmonella enterica]|nr:hydrogenase small subunit [Salmonella enterica]EJX2825746.1 hydrogenase small subunit [Salmonella enterica]EJX3183047.1 hydrogenase small subunit [Salmonella enterica]EJX3483911.1 hydrogenase small subunit [Salmonella enterica]EJX3488668.1 hydrogenase small subunit [Salmonella enterica]
MQTQDTFYQVMRRHGVTRRSFLKFCSLTATSLGLSSSMIPQIAYALENKPRTPVIWLHGLECTCCTESFIRSAHPLAKDAILSLISLDYDDTIMAAAGQQAEQALADVMREYKGNYIVAVEGNAPLNEDGMFCILAGEPFLEKLKRVSADAKAIIAWGSCASWGCVQAARPNPTKATPVHKLITDKPIIKVPGCPPIPEVMSAVITYMLAFDRIPPLDRLGRPKCIRNMMQATLHVHDHLVHFYHLHALDWVDVVAALKADPHQTSAIAQSLSAWPLSSPGYFRDLQNRLKRFIESGQLGPFRNGYWGHPAMKLPPEANLLAVAHYLEALDFQKEIVKIHTVFGGKNPHPNWLVGGVPCAINLDETGAVGAVNMERLNLVSSIIQKARQFCEQVYLPDVLLIASYYKDWAKIGGGLSSMNLLAYGEFPDNPNDYSASNLLLPRGAIINGRFDEIHPVDLTAPDEIQEFVTHSWYTYGNGNNDKGLHPWDGLTEPQLVMGEHYKGTKTFIEQVDESAKYSWIKSPRWKGHAMEVGPLARYLIGYHQNKPEFKEPVDQLLSVLKLPKEALFSTLGRTAARALESVWAGNTLQYFFDRLMRNLKSGDTATANVTLWEPDTWPTSAKGVGFSEAPRGALGHWIKIANQKIDSYQCVVPTTWNAGPRDDKGQIGAYEAALMGTKLAVPDQPLEILRTLHSFDPCLACSTHVIDNHGGELVRVQVR